MTEKNVRIAINKSLVKENNNREVFLKDGTEFQIQIYNPFNETVGVKGFINNITLGNYIVLYPGQRIWLDRHLINDRRFKYVTYEVDDSNRTNQAIENNGKITISFHKLYVRETPIIVQQPIIHTYPTYYTYSYDTTPVDTPHRIKTTTSNKSFLSSDANVISTEFGTCTANTISLACNSADATTLINTSCGTKETGIVTQGSRSNQQIQETSNMEFNFSPFHEETIQILPYSAKTFNKRDLEKTYCTQCGAKLKPTYKFCPHCGARKY